MSSLYLDQHGIEWHYSRAPYLSGLVQLNVEYLYQSPQEILPRSALVPNERIPAMQQSSRVGHYPVACNSNEPYMPS